MIDIVEIFNSLISGFRSIDMADRELSRLLDNDLDIKEAYIEWCEAEGYTLKKGFINYCQDYFDEEESRWKALNDDESYYDS